MNKVFNINLGGYPFTIDENAYHHLKQYLDAIDSHFKNSEGFEDITTDIETRLAEIFREKLQGRQIVTLSYVTQAINIMGTPEDFGAESNYTGIPEEEVKEEAASAKSDKTKSRQKFGKRLYRNPDDTIVGGVASGVSAYFGIEDPVWIRILLAIFIFSGGLGIPLYIILWIALPEAKTAKQKLEMRGEKIDVNNIAKTIEEELIHVKDKLNEFGDEFKKGSDKKKSGGKEGEEASYSSSKKINEGIGFVRDTAGAIEDLVRTIAKPLLYIIGWTLMIVLAAFWAALIIGSIFGHEYLQFLVGTAHAPFVSGALFLAIGIPLVSIALTVLRLFFRMKIHRGWSIGMIVAAILSVSGFFAFASIHARDFKIQQDVIQQKDLSSIQGDLLELNVEPFQNENTVFKINDVKIVDHELSYQHVGLNIQKAESDNFGMSVKQHAHGENISIAKKRAKAINYEPAINGNTVKIASFLTLKNEKWRNQTADVTLAIPVGKSVKISEEAANIFSFRVNAADGGYYYDSQLGGKTIKMTNNGVECLDCNTEPQGISQTKLDFQNFTQLKLTGKMKVHLHYGDTYRISLDQEVNQLSGLFTEQTDNTLSIDYSGEQEVRIHITVPSLEYLEINDVEDTWMDNFDVGFLKMTVTGDSEVHVNNLKANRLEIEAFNDAEITLKGEGGHLIAMFTDDARLDADRYMVKVADIKGYRDSDLKINVQDTLTRLITDDADLNYDGEPVMIQTVKE